MGPRRVRIQAAAGRVIAFPSSCAPVSHHADKWERPVRPDQVDGQPRTALLRTATANNAINHVNSSSGRLCATPHAKTNPKYLLSR